MANVPVILVPDKLPPVMLPVAETSPAVVKLPPTTLPVELTNPPVLILPPDTLPVTANKVNVPTEVILVCAAVASVPVILVPDKLPPVILPVALTCPAVVKLPPATFAVTANDPSVPTEVILV